MGPQFGIHVAPGGYSWWYLDALSHCGHHGLTLIAFLGSVFSPYYAAARRRAPGGRADALDHNAVNVALYDLKAKRSRWAMTERGRAALDRSEHSLRIGPSSLHLHGDTLEIELDEITAPWPSRIRGHIRVQANSWCAHPLQLDAAGEHLWSVLAPHATVEVCLSAPTLQWSGTGYLDHNHGAAPLERAFTCWDWSRARLADGSTAVVYDVRRRDGERHAWGRRFQADGSVQTVPTPEPFALPNTGWALPRSVRTEPGQDARVLHTLEDGPFYARSLVQAQWQGEAVTAFHESLSLQRFSSRVVQAMLPFRMPRRLRG